MNRPYVCLCLTANTLQDDLAQIDTYRKYIDIAELRADYLTNDERSSIRRFPEMAGIPCILTIRRKIDGGAYIESEESRADFFERALAVTDRNAGKNFAYVDFEEDFFAPVLRETAVNSGARVIRSYHNMTESIPNIAEKVSRMRVNSSEIAKIAATPKNLRDVTNMFLEAKKLKASDQILCMMGDYGLPTRILAGKLHSFLTYTSPKAATNTVNLGHIDPKTLMELYRFSKITSETAIYGVTGFPLKTTDSPFIHNAGYALHRMNAVYIPVKAETIEEALVFADSAGMKGLSVTVPHKETALLHLQKVTETVEQIGACNTLVRTSDGWTGYDTDAAGLTRSLTEFLGVKNLSGMKVAIIGAGGTAKAAAFAVKQLNGAACIFNRSVAKAKMLAGKYKFESAALGPESIPLLTKYNNLIIQTTPVGMNDGQDPLFFYCFNGTEAVYDVIYTPPLTPLLTRAKKAGCRAQNGRKMLDYQAYEQFKLFTGEPYETIYTS